MVDFTAKLGRKIIEKHINPIDIYDSLDRRSEIGPLRPAQKFILTKWYETKKDDKNLVIKLHTGEGKTLIGLLILQSKINSGQGPSLYLCPNKYLSKQVMMEAEKFGVSYCTLDEANDLPNDFFDSKKILITHVQKLFNGKTIFGLDTKSHKVGAVILDDSHACIDSIKDSFTICFDKDHEVYQKVLDIFEDDLRAQGEGSYLEIIEGDYESMLPISYWSWLEKKSTILGILSEYRDASELTFCWPFFKDNIENFQAFFNGRKIEISPYFVPIHHFGSFNDAESKILMSATTQDDSFFIKGLGFKPEAVENPLINKNQKWAGEKMILIPSLIHESLDRDRIVSSFGKKNEKLKFGIVFLTNSFKNFQQHNTVGSIVVKSEDIYDKISALKNKSFESPMVFVNRYDGIDLPDESCRVLIIDSRPYFNALSDKYEENCRNCPATTIITADDN